MSEQLLFIFLILIITALLIGLTHLGPKEYSKFDVAGKSDKNMKRSDFSESTSHSFSILTFSKYGAITGYSLGFIIAITQQNQIFSQSIGNGMAFALGFGIATGILGLLIGSLVGFVVKLLRR